MSAKPVTWSHSALNNFLTCPKQYHEVRVLKRYVSDSTHTQWGNDVHKALEQSLISGIPPTGNFAIYVDAVERFRRTRGTLAVEQQLAITNRFKPTGWFAPDVWCRGVIDALWVDGTIARIIDWKGLPLDTPIPTPQGWTTIDALTVNDRVLGRDGRPCKVVAKSKVHHRRCYRIIFDDKTTAECDDEHLWPLSTGAIVPASAVRRGDRMPIASALRLPHATLPIDPYVLGLWLADGKHSSGEMTKPDSFVWEEVQRRGYRIGDNYNRANGGARTHTIFGVRGALRAMGMPGNKHIPPVYLRASFSQRLDLLRGLMDGDGNANPTRKQAVFTTCSKRLSDEVKELLLSLGQRVNQATTTQRGFGLTVTAYPLAFRPIGINPFLLPRKAKRINPHWGAGQSCHRRVISVTEIGSVPTQCIAVDSPDNTYLCTKNFLVTHNTGRRKPDDQQLQLFALLTFIHYPEVDHVRAAFVWLQTGAMDVRRYNRAEIPHLWQDILPDVKRLEHAFATDTWVPKPSGLCRGWCPCKSCSFWDGAAMEAARAASGGTSSTT